MAGGVQSVRGIDHKMLNNNNDYNVFGWLRARRTAKALVINLNKYMDGFWVVYLFYTTVMSTRSIRSLACLCIRGRSFFVGWSVDLFVSLW